MNIYCIHCGEPFSITKEQLGKRGKCPHCRVTIVLPKSKQADGARDQAPVAPVRWAEILLCGMAAIALHLLMLAWLSLTPWGEATIGGVGESETILIGKLAPQPRGESSVDQWQEVAIENPLDRKGLVGELFQSLPPQLTAAAAESGWRVDSPVHSGDSADLWNEASMLAAKGAVQGAVQGSIQGDGFGNMITRLQRDGLDIVIVFDSTGSMQGEINDLKSKIQRIGTALIKLVPRTRIGICTYRDVRDAYAVKGVPLTENLTEITRFLNQVNAVGGGDEAESVDEGLRWAVEKNSFRPSARKVILLFGDAPPHANRQTDCERIAADFRNRQRGIVSTVTCRKDKPLPSFVSISKLGNGEAFLTQHEREIVQQLMVLMFGSQHREKVLQVFELLDP